MIVAVGISVIDHIMTLDNFKMGEGSFYCEDYLIEGGGMAATALCAASKLGASTRLFSRIGDDVNGQLILDGLLSYGVDTSGVVRIEGSHSTVSFVLSDIHTGKKQFYSEWIKPAFDGPVELDTRLLDGAEVLLVDCHWTYGALTAAQWARTRGVPVVADFKRKCDGLEALFPYVDYFIIPGFFAEELTGESDPEEALYALSELQSGIPVITMGSKGGMWLDGGKARKYRTFPIVCVDSTGAGDAFHGAFCYFLSRGLDLERCLTYSSAAGALNCRSLGGRSGLPSLGELAEFLKQNGVKSDLP